MTNNTEDDQTEGELPFHECFLCLRNTPVLCAMPNLEEFVSIYGTDAGCCQVCSGAMKDNYLISSCTPGSYVDYVRQLKNRGNGIILPEAMFTGLLLSIPEMGLMNLYGHIADGSDGRTKAAVGRAMRKALRFRWAFLPDTILVSSGAVAEVEGLEDGDKPIGVWLEAIEAFKSAGIYD